MTIPSHAHISRPVRTTSPGRKALMSVRSNPRSLCPLPAHRPQSDDRPHAAVRGGAGDDNVQVAGSVAAAVQLYGETGNDRLHGGAGDDIIVGGDGDDLLLGGSGRDLMVGGRGADAVVGNADGDLLIAGFTDYDNDPLSLLALQGVWVDPGLSDGQRTASLRDAALRDGVHLGTATVGRDASADHLAGAEGYDWFWYDPTRDRATLVKDEAAEAETDPTSPA